MEMLKETYRFNLGHFECLVIRAGTFTVPDTQPGQLLGPYDMQPGQIIEANCLFIRTGDHAVLVDTGSVVGEQTNAGKLIQNLQAEGIQCVAIDTVILSHAHPDHIGGNTSAEGKPAFPNARYIMYKEEWEFWTADPDLMQYNVEESEKQALLKVVQRNLQPIKDQVYLIDGGTEIVSGIELMKAPGHSPGHILPIISSGSEQLLCICDLFHRPLELDRPDWHMSPDMMPEQASRTRIQILSHVVTPDMLVFACHFPFPGLGHIVPKGDVWQWQPIEIKGKT